MGKRENQALGRTIETKCLKPNSGIGKRGSRTLGIIKAEDSLKLNIGSGRKPYPDFVNIDKAPLPETDLVWNLEKTPIPFAENSVEEVRAEHVLEHIWNYIPLIEDLWRVCKPGARIYIEVPYFKYEGAFRDPTHCHFFSEYSFEYFSKGYEYAYYSNARFKVKEIKLKTTSKTRIKNLHKRIVNYIPFKKLLNIFFWNLYTEITYNLEVVK